jgi:hypothetical protein
VAAILPGQFSWPLVSCLSMRQPPNSRWNGRAASAMPSLANVLARRSPRRRGCRKTQNAKISTI